MNKNHVPDRYPVNLDCRPFVGRLARTYQFGRGYRVDPALRALFVEEINNIYRLIPVNVMFMHGGEPYASAEEMAQRVADEKVFIVRWRDGELDHSTHYLQGAHMLFRAVHDWYGHIQPNNPVRPFTMDGELLAYCDHVRSSMFSPAVLPLIWSEVVLENAYRLWHGEWSPIARPVYDPDFGRVPEANLNCICFPENTDGPTQAC